MYIILPNIDITVISFLIKRSKQNYYYFKSYNKNIKNIWSGIRQLITLKSKKANQTTKIVHRNQTITNPKEIASAFNKFFSSIG